MLSSALESLVSDFFFAADFWPSLVSQVVVATSVSLGPRGGEPVVPTTLPLGFVVRISEVTLRCCDHKNFHI